MKDKLQALLIDDLNKLEKNINVLIDMINTTNINYTDTQKPINNIENFICYWKQHNKQLTNKIK